MEAEVVRMLREASVQLDALLAGAAGPEPGDDDVVALLRLDRVATLLVEALRVESCAQRAGRSSG